MEDWRRDARHEPIIVDLEALVPKDHLLRKIEKVMITNGCMKGCRRITAITMAGPGRIRLF